MKRKGTPVRGWKRGAFGSLIKNISKSVVQYDGPKDSLDKALNTIKKRFEVLKNDNIIHDFEMHIVVPE